MFVRKKRNKSGLISVQIIDKSTGKYTVLKTIGSSLNPEEVEKLVLKAQLNIIEFTQQPVFNFEIEKEQALIDSFFSGIEEFILIGPELILGKIFDQIGFNKIEDKLFRHLVITRLIYPVSKLKTIDYLFKYQGSQLSIDSVYRYLDKLHADQISIVQQIGYDHAFNLSGGDISVVFYDVTTLYFEAENEDDLRKIGFSKDGKNQQPQIVLGLLVNSSGYPLGYKIFEGNTFEGHTMIPVIQAFQKKYGFQELIVVADAGLMSSRNLEALEKEGFPFIIGARMKNESKAMKKQILDLALTDGKSAVLSRQHDQRLIVHYSTSRAKKDAHNRKRGLEKLEKSLKAGRLSKQSINNKGYNKYLKIEGELTVAIDYEKYEFDAVWDGLKGYLTNTTLRKEKVIDQYQKLFQIEKTFRISKTDLRMRPIFHHLKRRIEAHICICFAACIIYKELERISKLNKSNYSPEKIIDITKTIYRLSIITPYSKTKYTRLIIKTEEQKAILTLFKVESGCPSA